MFARRAPRDLELATRQLDLDGGIESSMTSADRHRGACAGAAGQRFANTAFEDAQADVRAIDDFHETDIHSFRKAWVTLDGGPESIDGRTRGGRDREHRVGITHGHGSDLHFSARDGERIHMRFGGGFERQRFRIEVGHAHVHRDEVVIVDSGMNRPGRAIEHDFTAIPREHRGAIAPVHERGEATGAVAALLHLAAVGVENTVIDMGARAAGRLEHQRLIKPDARMTRRQRAPLSRCRQGAVTWRLEDNEVIAETVHFGELELHVAKNTLRSAAMRLAPIAVAVVAAVAIFKLYSSREIEHGPGVLAGDDPVQSDIDSAALIERGEFRLRPRADFRATVRILRREDYSIGALADLVPTDFAVGWGPMSDSAVLADIEISQGNRFYYWRTESWPIAREAIETHSANWHLISASPDVGEKLARVRAGSLVQLRGQLVDIEGTEAGMRTSLSRTDTGAGACEILLADSVDIVGP
jgi:hypothetical protein